MVDARSGAVVTITADLAERLAREEHQAAGRVRGVTLMEQRDAAYMFGPMPAWRVAFDDGSTVSYVALTDGSVRRSDSASRVRNIIVSTHTFAPMNIVNVGRLARKPLLIITSVIGVIAVMTGYYLSLPNRWRVRRASKSDPARIEAVAK
jgi:hypothetical protein